MPFNYATTATAHDHVLVSMGNQHVSVNAQKQDCCRFHWNLVEIVYMPG